MRASAALGRCIITLVAGVAAAALHEPPQTALQHEVKEATTTGEGAAFAQRLMRDPYTFCGYLCDFSKLWRNDYNQCTKGSSRACAAEAAWPSLPPSSVAENCPEVAAQASADFSPETLSVPAGTNLVVYGQSYMKQIFQVIVAANSDKLVTNSTEFRGPSRVPGDYNFVCAGGAGGEIVGPRCGAPYNCHPDDHVVYHLSNGATITGVFNYWSLQHAITNDAVGAASVSGLLSGFIRQGAGKAGAFTHALVMEPHGFDFFEAETEPGGSGKWNEELYGCGWSDSFWQAWNKEGPPGKVRHIFPWGYNQTILDRVHPAAPRPALNLDPYLKRMPCHTEPGPERSMTVLRKSNQGIEGHLCTAAKDSTGYFLGPIPYMAEAVMRHAGL